MRWTKGEGWKEITCTRCGVAFTARRCDILHGRRFCSQTCARQIHRGQHYSRINDDLLVEMYNVHEKSVSAIAAELGYSISTVSSHLQKAGVITRPNGANLQDPTTKMRAVASHARGETHPFYQDIPIDEIVARYSNGESLTFIASSFRVTPITISRRLKIAGVPMRESGFSKWHTADDGHRVQSFWELRVDNWLYAQGVPHTTQPKLPFGRNTRADFLARGYYIEVWGIFRNPAYSKRKHRKLAGYKEHGMKLIELYPIQITEADIQPLHVLLLP